MFYDEKRLAYTVRVDTPNPLFAKRLQQAIGGIEGEIRVMRSWPLAGHWEEKQVAAKAFSNLCPSVLLAPFP
jgi:Mn-containing catalase